MALRDPLHIAEQLRGKVVSGDKRRYYRVGRTGGWYGSIATADCCGCNLACIFCWSNFPRENPQIGRFYEPEEIAAILVKNARRKRYDQVRISGNEPTIGKKHLLKVVDIVEQSGLRFILETNGTLIDRDFAKGLKIFKNVHVRVSLKGADEREFEILTETSKSGYQLQLEALKYLYLEGVSCHAAVMVSFSSRKNLYELKNRLKKISSYFASSLEEESIILYPHIKKRLLKKGLLQR